MTTRTHDVRKRADARRNVAAILEAARCCLATNPDASVSEIARAAGVGRVTLYGHFESRRALITEVVQAAMADSERELAAVDLSGDAVVALTRLLRASWRVTHRYGALVQAAEQAMPPRDFRSAHDQPVKRMTALLRRGRKDGVFRSDMPLTWQITTIQSLLHGASAAVHRGDHTPDQAGELVVKSVLATLGATDRPARP